MTKKKEKGQLIVLSGPSGVGKSTVIAELLGQRKGIYFSVSYTTRQPRVDVYKRQGQHHRLEVQRHRDRQICGGYQG